MRTVGCRDVLEHEGLREMIALRKTYARCSQQICELLEGLDALRQHRHSERFARRFDPLENTLAARAPMNIGNEGAVDLDLVGSDLSASTESEEYPVPKSSIETRAPISRSMGKTCA
jgi:hypothetical protein